MRIRRRPTLPLSPQKPNFSLQIQPPNRREESGLHPDGDLSAAPQHGWMSTDPTSSDPHPKQVFKEEKDFPSSSSHKKTLDAQAQNNERIGEEMERNAKVTKERTDSISTSTTTTALSNSTVISSGSNVGVVREEVNSSNGKKRRSPAVLMEGSRCSRVNGRGWRCSQQTLIGYSLCEHHLGKGRLKNITSTVRVGSQMKKNDMTTGKKPKKKERDEKFGVVKARSISSLLDEAEYADAMANAESKMALV